jgi:phosphoglucosamine mutase
MALFGTDGIRGRFGEFLTVDLAERVAYAAGLLIPERSRVIVGRDTRSSGPLLEAGLVSGFVKSGHDVVRIGVIPTPGLAYLALEEGVRLAAMITASHNPAADNGIKIFGHDGMKISDGFERDIETWVHSNSDIDQKLQGSGTVDTHAIERYADHLVRSIDVSLDGLRIALDCAHGSAAVIAPKVLTQLGAEVSAIGITPNGENINAGVGSTHLGAIQDLVKSSGADLGITHDGDADRVLLVDNSGRIIDGDHMLATLALAMAHSGELSDKTVVTTVMSNLGFHKAMAAAGINVEITAVGDRYVLERINQRHLALGGEQSGHIIIKKLATTGDGILTALKILSLIVEKKVAICKLAEAFTSYPQVLVNVSVGNKESALADQIVTDAIASAERSLGESGRLLVRASGTEDMVRVMAQADTFERAKSTVDSLASLISSRHGAWRREP